MMIWLQYMIYPVFMCLGINVAWFLLSQGIHHVLVFISVMVPYLVLVRLVEKAMPFEQQWNNDKGDFLLDVKYNIVNLGIISATLALYEFSQPLLSLNFWPTGLPVAVQILLAGLIIDLGMYTIHRLSHSIPFLWRFHLIHHSSERLYLLNGEKRHLFHAILEGTPGVSALLILGAPPSILAFWFIILNLHLCFQHGNINYRAGILRFIFSVAELHRWHHRKEYSQSQVNYGAVFSFWDMFLGSYLRNPPAYDASDIGLSDVGYPGTFVGQFQYPFKKIER